MNAPPSPLPAAPPGRAEPLSAAVERGLPPPTPKCRPSRRPFGAAPPPPRASPVPCSPGRAAAAAPSRNSARSAGPPGAPMMPPVPPVRSGARRGGVAHGGGAGGAGEEETKSRQSPGASRGHRRATGRGPGPGGGHRAGAAHRARGCGDPPALPAPRQPPLTAPVHREVRRAGWGRPSSAGASRPGRAEPAAGPLVRGCPTPQSPPGRQSPGAGPYCRGMLGPHSRSRGAPAKAGGRPGTPRPCLQLFPPVP